MFEPGKIYWEPVRKMFIWFVGWSELGNFEYQAFGRDGKMFLFPKKYYFGGPPHHLVDAADLKMYEWRKIRDTLGQSIDPIIQLTKDSMT